MADKDTTTETTDSPEEELEDKSTEETPGKDDKDKKTDDKPEDTPEDKKESKEEPEDKEKDKEEPDSKDKEPDKDDKKDGKADPEIEKLTESLEKKETELTDLKGKLDDQKEEAKQHKSRSEELEKVISGVVENKVSDIPEGYKELMPEGDPVKQLEWLNKAEEKGVFKKEKENPEVEVGKNISLDKKGKEQAKTEVSSHQRLSNYFSKAFSGK